MRDEKDDTVGEPDKDTEEPGVGDLQDLACAVSEMLYGGELGWTHHPMKKTIADLRKRVKAKAGAGVGIGHFEPYPGESFDRDAERFLCLVCRMLASCKTWDAVQAVTEALTNVDIMRRDHVAESRHLAGPGAGTQRPEPGKAGTR